MPTKTAVRAFCAAIRNGELDEVRAQLAADPELAHTTVSAPPKNDDGQSPLQIAFKTGRYDAAELLVAAGADVNHMERESVNAWRTPVLHDAIRGCMLSNEPERALAWVERLLELGADANGRDSFGNSALDRAMLDARQILHIRDRWPRVPPVVAALIRHGADIHATHPRRPSRMRRAYRGGRCGGMVRSCAGLALARGGRAPTPERRRPEPASSHRNAPLRARAAQGRGGCPDARAWRGPRDGEPARKDPRGLRALAEALPIR